jgi:hypothetical protein
MPSAGKLYHGSDAAFDTLKGSKAAYTHDGYGAGHAWSTTSKFFAKSIARNRHLTGGLPTDQLPNGAHTMRENKAAFKDHRILHKAMTRSLPKKRRTVGYLHEVDPAGFHEPDVHKMRAAGVIPVELKYLVPRYRVKHGDARVLNTKPIKEGRTTRPLIQKEADALAVGGVAAAGTTGGAYYYRTQHNKQVRVKNPNWQHARRITH